MAQRPNFSRMKDNTLIFGWHPVLEALTSAKDLQRIFLIKGSQNERAVEVIKLAKERLIPIQMVPPEKLDRLTKKQHQGVVAFLSPIEYADVDNLIHMLYERGETPMLIALDGVTDVRNFGAICRSAEGLGFHGVIIPSTGTAPLNEDAIKTSSGALLRLPVCRVPQLSRTLQTVQASGIYLCGMTEKGNTDLHDVAHLGPVCVVMGNEEFGLSPSVMRLCDALVRIPMAADMASLNVSASAAIAMYHWAAQNRANQQ